MKDNEMRAWRSWKTTCYTMLVIALLLTVVRIVMGGETQNAWSVEHSICVNQMSDHPCISVRVADEP